MSAATLGQFGTNFAQEGLGTLWKRGLALTLVEFLLAALSAVRSVLIDAGGAPGPKGGGSCSDSSPIRNTQTTRFTQKGKVIG